MKKWILILMFVSLAGFAFAHPPVIDSMVYDANTKLLTINITHDITKTKVTDITKHYVKEVDVSINSNKVITQLFKTQENPVTEVLVYKILVNNGDIVAVDAACSLAGAAHKEITIGK